MKFLFLMSHGLRSTLSAIRWGCGRLRKTNVGQLNAEQAHLVDEIHRNAKRLSTALRSMFLLAQIEEKSYFVKRQPLFLAPLLQALIQKGLPEHAHRMQLSCPEDLQLQTDRELLETTLLDLFAVFTESNPQPSNIFVHVTKTAEGIDINIHASVELAVLRPLPDTRDVSRLSQAIGDIPGLMLSLGSALGEFLDGSVDVEETVFNEEAEDALEGAEDFAALPGEEYKVSLKLPFRLPDQLYGYRRETERGG
jgi:signal transduction histidine kinase